MPSPSDCNKLGQSLCAKGWQTLDWWREDLQDIRVWFDGKWWQKLKNKQTIVSCIFLNQSKQTRIILPVLPTALSLSLPPSLPPLVQLSTNVIGYITTAFSPSTSQSRETLPNVANLGTKLGVLENGMLMALGPWAYADSSHGWRAHGLQIPAKMNRPSLMARYDNIHIYIYLYDFICTLYEYIFI